MPEGCCGTRSVNLDRPGEFVDDEGVDGRNVRYSRLREVILGGASRTLLSSMTVPVLTAH